MNSIATLALVYGLMTFASATILYVSFRGRFDCSARYFMLAELAILFASPCVFLINVNPSVFETQSLLALATFLLLVNSVAVFFSIYALTRPPKPKQAFWALVGIIGFSALTEISRAQINGYFPLLLVNLFHAAFCLATYALCRSRANQGLFNNQFIQWIGRLELALGFFALTRAFSYFTDSPLLPRHPDLIIGISYTLYVVLSLYRYIAYQSLRISWVDGSVNKSNHLNHNLAKAMEEKEELYKRLLASNRVLGISALASSLSHQLSQPLGSIGIQAEIIERDLIKSGGSSSAIASSHKISAQVAKLSDLVKNLRQLFKAHEHKNLTVNLQEITCEILEILKPTLRTKKIRLKKIFEANPVVKGDGIQLQQVLINLFNNAIDAIDAGPTQPRLIQLLITSNEEMAIIKIEDSGVGISSEQLPEMFDLYKTTKEDGLGVGLWLSKTIIDKHKGVITASNGPNGGAIFEIHIPLFLSKVDQS